MEGKSKTQNEKMKKTLANENYKKESGFTWREREKMEGGRIKGNK